MSLAGPWEPERDDDEETADPPNTSTARRYDIDPADPTRRVVHKRINSAYLKHQRWKEKQQQQQQQQQQDEQRLASMSNATGVTSGGDATAARQRGNGRAAAAAAAAAAPSSNGPAKHAKDGTPVARRSLTFVVGKWLLVTLLLAVGAGQFIAGDLLWGYRGRYTKIETYVPPTGRVFTPEELMQYNGADKTKPVYVAVLGNVYDVTAGRWIYQPGATYHAFAGRDASRAFVTGCFETHRTHDLRGLSMEELVQIDSWKTFYEDHRNYHYVGKVVLPQIDPASPIPAPCRDG